MDKQKQAARNQKEDVVLNRTLIWFGGAVVVELLLLLLNRYYINYNVSGITLMSNIHKALPVMIAALAVLTVVCAVWLYTGLKKKRSGLIPGLLTGVFGALALGCLAAFRFKGAGIQLMCTLVPAVAVLALGDFPFPPPPRCWRWCITSTSGNFLPSPFYRHWAWSGFGSSARRAAATQWWSMAISPWWR